MTDILIDLIRHGEPVGGSKYRGHQIDDPLSDTGWVQMWDAVGQYRQWDRIISSPLQRCHAFATALHDKYGIPITVEKDFREIGFGSWEGKTRQQLQQERLAEYQDFYRDPVNCRPAGAEPLDEFINRVTRGYENILQQNSGKRLLIVAHAGVIRAVIAHVLHAKPIGLYRIKVANAGITRIRHGRNGGIVEYQNASMHQLADNCRAT